MLALLSFFCLIFAFMLMSMAFGADYTPSSGGNDYMIPIATIIDDPPLKRARSVAREPSVEVQKDKPKQHPLYEDCVNVLIGLGERKSSAKMLAKKILESNHVESVEDFVTIAFSR